MHDMMRSGHTSRELFAATGLLEQSDALAAQADAVKEASDIESIHKMRVASRRLRNAMNLFNATLPPKQGRKWMKQIKRITSALGAARDLDVQIEFVRHFIEGMGDADRKSNEAGIARLLLRLEQRRERVQPRVVDTMEKIEKSQVIHQMQTRLRDVISRARASGVSPTSPELRDEARQTILHRLEDVFVYENAVHHPSHAEPLHEMRIAFKYLRYTQDAYGPLFEGGLKKQVKLAKSFQSLLGDLHDADVWIEFLPRFEEAEKRRFVQFYGKPRGFPKIHKGITFFVDNMVQRRQKIYEDFVAAWDRRISQGTWDEFRQHFRQDDGPVRLVPETPPAPADEMTQSQSA